MSHNARVILPLAILALLFIGFAVYFTSSTTSDVDDSNNTSTSDSITNPEADLGLRAISRYNPSTQQVEVYLSPSGASQDLNNMAIRITFQGSGLSSSSQNPELSQEFLNSQWSSPFGSVENTTEETVVFSLALLNSSPNAFSLQNEVKLASFSVETTSPDSMTATLDPTVSQLFDLNGIEYQFDFSDELSSANSHEQS